MHKGVILLVKAENRTEAKEKAESFLAEYESDVWDWYQIGGRWSGELTGYDPDKDPQNLETCAQCGGTGIRTDEVGVANGMTTRQIKEPGHPRNGQIGWCNGCGGRGTSVKWPTEWQDRTDDVQALDVVKSKVEEWSKDWEKEALADVEKSLARFAGDKSMQGYLLKKKGAILHDNFSFESNVYDVENCSNSIPKDTNGYWAVMVDMHI